MCILKKPVGSCGMTASYRPGIGRLGSTTDIPSISSVVASSSGTTCEGVDTVAPDMNMVASPHNVCRCGDTAGAVVNTWGTWPEVEQMVQEVAASFGHMQRDRVSKQVWHKWLRWRTVARMCYWSHKVLLNVLLPCMKQWECSLSGLGRDGMNR
jgi:hypothetical protein